MNSRYRKTTIFLIPILIFLVISFLFLVILFLSIFLPSFRTPIPRTYQLTRINLSKDKTTFGIARTTRYLDSDKYLSYSNTDDDGDTIFIQNFGGKEYSCSGSCYCKKPTRKNAGPGSSLLAKGISVFLPSFSILLASKMAQKTVLEHCNREYSEVCGEDEIEANVNCKMNFEETIKAQDTKKLSLSHDGNNIMEFACRGRCVENEDWPEEGSDLREPLAAWFKEFGRCEMLMLEEKLEFIEFDITMHHLLDYEKFDLEVKAGERFGYNNLWEYCAKMSRLPPPNEENHACIPPRSVMQARNSDQLLECKLMIARWDGRDIMGKLPLMDY